MDQDCTILLKATLHHTLTR